ncbi:glycosyltransferase family 4 protein [Trichocoleus sp. DQ-A3]|uniref:glycosyltransferase family 4 protein n=1 Tax=Cyanophyceae TaxID=3028117 RepID=UPI001688773A|nr:glycosyltransferase family 4 protein [Coleofasciculus sp. FACHB-125]MBD1903544.1 glycosyltransferase family 4 protein [Coleofasciculus sp. FACHB-125]
MKITLVISSLSCGGAERVLALLAQGFFRKGYEVAVLTLSGIESDFYKLPDAVHRLALNIAENSPTPAHAIWNNLYRIWILREAIISTRPDVVISFLDKTNVLTLLALIKTSYPVIATEHCDPSIISCGSLWEKLRRLTYPYTVRLVSVSQGVDSYFDWLPKTKRTVIYNPLAIGEDEQNSITLPKGADLGKKLVIAMGRLTYIKGFDILLSAFSKIADKHLDWQLLILGKGNLRIELENQRDSLGLTERVFFLGSMSNPFPILKLSKLFVMSSRTEGFGNVLIEAMACGLPVISTDCPSGPREIIRDGVNGILVQNGDVEALAVAMDRLMSDRGERKRLADRAADVTERFSLEKIMGMWEALISEVMGER